MKHQSIVIVLTLLVLSIMAHAQSPVTVFKNISPRNASFMPEN